MKRFIQFLILLGVYINASAMGTSPLIFEGSVPASGQSVSSLETVTLNWNLENIIRDFGEDTWGVCVLTQNYENVEEKLYSALYEGTPEQGIILAIDDTQIRYTKVKAGNTTTLSFPNVTIKPGQLYTVVITSNFYVQKPKKNNTALKNASWYDEPITLTFYGQASDGIWVENVVPSGDSEIDNISEVSVQFSSPVKLNDGASATIYENSELVAKASSLKISADNANTLLVGFDDVPLYSTHEYSLVINANSVSDEKGNGNDEITRTFKGASFHELKVGRVSPANNRSVSWLSTIYMPFALEDGFCLSSIDELKSRLIDASGNVIAENIPFEQSQDMKALTFNIWNFNLTPNSSYQFIVDEGQINPAYSANPTAKKKDTANKKIILNYTTPSELEKPAKVNAEIVPAEGGEYESLDIVTFNLPDYEFENNSYYIKLATENPVAIFSDGTNETSLPLTFNANEKKATCEVNCTLEAGKTYTLKIPAGTFAPSANANLAAVAANDELVYTFTDKAADSYTLTYAVEGQATLVTEVAPQAEVKVSFPENDGFKVASIAFNGEQQAVAGTFTTPAIAQNSVLDIAYEYAGKIDYDFTTGVTAPEDCPFTVTSEGEMLVVEGVKAGDTIRIYTAGGLMMADLGAVPAGMSRASFRLATGQVYILLVNTTALKLRH